MPLQKNLFLKGLFMALIAMMRLLTLLAWHMQKLTMLVLMRVFGKLTNGQVIDKAQFRYLYLDITFLNVPTRLYSNETT